jgi:HlyD family secretion protein
MNMQAKGDLFLRPRPAEDGSRETRLGLAIAFFFFVVLLGWAALAPLDAAVRGSGVISVLGNRQAVQHPTGGVVTTIDVREGQHVQAGQVLVELAAPEAQAAERALTSAYLSLLAQNARLIAEANGETSFAPPPEFATVPAKDRPLADRAYQLQLREMQARASSLQAQQSVLGQRGKQLLNQQVGAREQRAAIAEQRRIMSEELAGMREIAKRGFAALNRIRALERAEADLTGREAAMEAEMARAAEGFGETRSQTLALSRKDEEEVATELRETESKLSEVLPKLVAAREELSRSQVRAPATGTVVGLNVFTVGGVVSAGQVMMNIIPDDRSLVIQAQIKPVDADDVYEGQKAELRFASVNDRSLPLLDGKVRTVSAESFTDESTGQAYFRAEVQVPPAELEKVQQLLGKGELRPGLPVEVMFSVRKRTALQYLLEPFTESFHDALHEQ